MIEDVRIVSRLWKDKKYSEVISMGMNVLRHPLTELEKADLCQLIAGSFYNLGNLEAFIDWKNRGMLHVPNSRWQDKLRMLGDGAFARHFDMNCSDEALAEYHFLAQEIVSNVSWVYTEERKSELAKRFKEKTRKIKIGYISQEIFYHINLCFLIQLLNGYNKNEFEVYLYALNDINDNSTEQIRSFVTCFRSVGKNSIEEIAEQIYEDKIDILMDISVHSGGSRTLSVVAYKPAPIIISGIGYMSTSGMKAVDYFLTDVYCDPEGDGDKYFSEKLIRLPHSHFCYTPMEHVQHFQINTDIHKPIVFGSLNSFRKLNKYLLKHWLHIMDKVPDSRLLLQSNTDEFIKRQMYKDLLDVGFDMNRVELRSSSGNYFGTYNDIDIALDSYPYTGGGTTCDSLYMGVPVITLEGSRHGTRFGSSLLKNMGLDVLVATNWDEYEDIAVCLAKNPEIIKLFHCSLRETMMKSPVMNARLYVTSVENAYKKIWSDFLKEY